MDKLQEVVGTFSTDDQKEFRNFLRRQTLRKDRKDLALFDWLVAQPKASGRETLKHLYPNENRVAYHALRKRLLRHMSDYIVLKRLNEDTSSVSTVMGLLSLCRYLFEKGSSGLAWDFLRKAEKTAIAGEQFELLHSVYQLQVEMADREGADELTSIVEKRHHNKQLADEDERASIASSLIRQSLRQVRLDGRELDFDAIVQQVLAEYGLQEAIAKRPKLMYNIVSMVRSAMLAKKDFYSFEPFIIAQYSQMEASGGFTKVHQLYQVNLLYMIAHVLYRNKKFAASNLYLRQLQGFLEGDSRQHFPTFRARFVLLKAANHSYIGESRLGAEQLAAYLAKPEGRPTPAELLNVRLNLAVYQFQLEDFRQSNRLLQHFPHSDAWCAKKMGREWVLRKNMVELIVQIELGNTDIAHNRLRAIERQFKSLFEQPTYRRVRQFLLLLRFTIDYPERLATPEFAERIDRAIEFIPASREDLNAMGFYAWIKAKLIQKPYYATLLELVAAEDA